MQYLIYCIVVNIYNRNELQHKFKYSTISAVQSFNPLYHQSRNHSDHFLHTNVLIGILHVHLLCCKIDSFDHITTKTRSRKVLESVLDLLCTVVFEILLLKSTPMPSVFEQESQKRVVLFCGPACV